MTKEEIWADAKPMVVAAAKMAEGMLLKAIDSVVASTSTPIDDALWASLKSAVMKAVDEQISHI